MIKNLLKDLIEDLTKKEKYKLINDEMKSALLELFDTYWNKVIFGEYNFLEIEEKIDFIRDTLENNSLKQFLGYTEHKILITTVHGAKGLEWDYVILPDMEQYSFPNWSGLCGLCKNKNTCKINWKIVANDNNFLNNFYNELSVFYVAVTRARNKNIFTASKQRLNSYNNSEINTSCFLKLPGLEVKCVFLTF
ncbi:MAG: 3'-5' exonuclease [Breznakiellaceae bacterium]